MLATTCEPDYASLQLQGDASRQDTFSLVLAAAAGFLGRGLGYETIFLLSTNAFAPDIRPEEPCRSTWCLQGRGRCLDLVTAAAGLSWRVLHQPRPEQIPSPPRDPGARAAWLGQYYRRPHLPYIREALDRGEVVIADLQWDARDALWCGWGIITDARDPDTILGVTVEGVDRRIEAVRGSWIALRPARPALAPGEARLEVLRRAAQRILGQGLFVARSDAAGRRVVYGVDAMAVWIDRMRQVPFAPEGEEAGRRQAPDTALGVSEGARAAAHELRRLAQETPAPAQGHLLRAARHYGSIRRLLAPALTGKGGPSYAEFMGDPAAQAAHARTLEQVRDEFSAAAEAIGEALSSRRARV